MGGYEVVTFSNGTVWQSILLIGVLVGSLIIANVIKTTIPFFRKSLLPNAVLGGLIVLIISAIVFYTTGDYLFNHFLFSSNGSGISTLEVLTYHCLALGFIALTLRPSPRKLTKKRTVEIIDSGVSTIGTYMLQAILGIVITIVAAKVVLGFAPGSGVLLCFGFGQGTGQALNIGKNFDVALGTNFYASFGLAIAAFGFLTASIVGVIYLNHLRNTGKIDPVKEQQAKSVNLEEIQSADETPMNESVDKLSIQIGLVFIAYLAAYGIMFLLGNVILGVDNNMTGTIYGFNFLFGVLAAALMKGVLNALKKHGVIKRQYTNTFLLNRISGLAFDLMIVSGICAIQLDLISHYIGIFIILGVVGAIATFLYLRTVSKSVFPEYRYEQFLAWFGMLTGTASTGMILLREADPELLSPVSENLVYQNFPAIILAVPLLFIANNLTANAASTPATVTTLLIVIGIFVVLNLFLFRRKIFRRKQGAPVEADAS